MHRLLAQVPGQNVIMLRICCDRCAHRVARTDVMVRGDPVTPTLHHIEGKGARACDIHDIHDS